MAKVKVADVEIELTIEELIELFKKTEPSEIISKLKAVSEAKKPE